MRRTCPPLALLYLTTACLTNYAESGLGRIQVVQHRAPWHNAPDGQDSTTSNMAALALMCRRPTPCTGVLLSGPLARPSVQPIRPLTQASAVTRKRSPGSP